MELLQQYRKKFESVVEKYYHEANQTEQHWEGENVAALKIQSKFRMYIHRKSFIRMKKAATRIQTAYRAYSKRCEATSKRILETERRQLQYFAEQATVIQKVFRGFYTRKYGPNFYKRKEELEDLKRKNEEFKIQLDKYGAQQEIEQRQRKQQIARAQFNELGRNLHHLTSTRAIPGVYNSPYVDTKPSAFNTPVEDHLKAIFSNQYKWKPPNRKTILKHSIKKA